MDLIGFTFLLECIMFDLTRSTYKCFERGKKGKFLFIFLGVFFPLAFANFQSVWREIVVSLVK